jgi:hypothetical protein
VEYTHYLVSTALTSDYYTHCTVVHSLHGLHDIALTHKVVVVLTPPHCTYYTDHGTTLPTLFLLIFIPQLPQDKYSYLLYILEVLPTKLLK